MRTILVTGSDTGIGKTWAVSALARLLSEDGAAVQVVKVVETGSVGIAAGDAERARSFAGGSVSAITLASFPAPLAPAAAAAAAGGEISLQLLVKKAGELPACDWRIFEGAGGIATPIDDRGCDWADFSDAVGADAVVIVVPDRLGAINQARLAWGRAVGAGLRAGVWLNAGAPVERAVAESTRAGLRSAGVPIWAEQACGAVLPEKPESVLRVLRGSEAFPIAGEPTPRATPASGALADRCRAVLADRDDKKTRRRLRVTTIREGMLNLADNDYLDLSRDPAVSAAVAESAKRDGTSASASPLITGWREPHERLVESLCGWHRFPFGLLWSSGYAANSAVLGTLPRRGDVVLADRLIHHSMIAGLQRSGARIHRYPHLDLDQLERSLDRESGKGSGADRCPIFVVTESVFSMDGDYPDLRRLADLKRRYGFNLILDEAHALGWYGPEGAGLALVSGAADAVDILVGTLGKTLASGGAYTLFRDESLRDALINFAGEFIYSTSLPPANAAGALAALNRVRTLAAGQGEWQASSRAFRSALRSDGWAAPDGDSPVVPVRLDDEDAAVALAGALREVGILTAAVRPPTVPAGTSRLRFSLKRGLSPADFDRVLAAMRSWRSGRAGR